MGEELSEIVNALRAELQLQLLELQQKFALFKKEYRLKTKEKFRAKSSSLMESFSKEREAILSVVKIECTEILNDAKEMFLQQRNRHVGGFAY